MYLNPTAETSVFMSRAHSFPNAKINKGVGNRDETELTKIFLLSGCLDSKLHRDLDGVHTCV